MKDHISSYLTPEELNVPMRVQRIDGRKEPSQYPANAFFLRDRVIDASVTECADAFEYAVNLCVEFPDLPMERAERLAALDCLWRREDRDNRAGHPRRPSSRFFLKRYVNNPSIRELCVAYRRAVEYLDVVPSISIARAEKKAADACLAERMGNRNWPERKTS